MNCNALIYFLSRDQCAKAKLRCPPLESTCDSSTKATLGCPPFFTIFLGQAVGVTWIRLILRVKWHLYHAKVSCIKCHPLCVKGLTSKQQSFCIKILQNKDLLRQLTSTATIKFIYSEKATNFCEICTVDWSYGQIFGGDFSKFCGLLRIYELIAFLLEQDNLYLFTKK